MGDCAKIIALRTLLSVVYADDVNYNFTICKESARGGQCGAGRDDVIIEYHLALGYGAQQMKFRVKAIAVDTLNGIGVEWYAEPVRYLGADSRGQMKAIAVSAAWRGDDAPVFRIADKTTKEVASTHGKLAGYLGRLLNLAEWYSLLGAFELREVNERAEGVNSQPGLKVTQRDNTSLQPWPRGRSVPFVHACYLTALPHLMMC